ncbi:hypothetical protein BT69DRAFT_1216651 [Atractiella rhizophila]|nr:hypothetical protein BT69DRAFT_1216651 [Atractiella rhizophila]
MSRRGGEAPVPIASHPVGALYAPPERKKKNIFKTKKCIIFSLAVVPVTLVIAVVILIYVVLKPVAKHTLHTSVIHVAESNLTSLTNNSFDLTLQGKITKAGIFPAQVHFKEKADVYWINPYTGYNEVQLGQFPLARLGITSRGKATLKQLAEFEITDEDAFGDFTVFLLTQEAFTWRIKADRVQAKAFAFLNVNDLPFSKDTTLAGIANFSNIEILDFQLPGNDPQGGITLFTTTRLYNPSAFGVELGTLKLDLWYNGHYIGPAQTASSLNLTTGYNTFDLTGRILPAADNATALAILSDLFTRYVNGDVSNVTARGVDVIPPTGEATSWLKKGIQALELNVPLRSPQPINPIKAITIESLAINYTPETSWNPMTSSPGIRGTIGLPFGFSFNITDVQNQFSLYTNGTEVASVTAPFGQSSTRITSQNAGYTTGDLDITLPPTALQLPDNSYDSHLVFSQFQYDLTTTNGSRIDLNGSATAITDTPIGTITLDGVRFAVPAGLIGLEGLKKYPTVISSVDVLGGTADYIELGIQVGLNNPSNLELATGDVTFQLFNGDYFLGQSLLPNLSLAIGPQTVAARGFFQANANPGALDTLNRFANGLDTSLFISGFNGSTSVDSLTQAFMAIHLNATLPGLDTPLLGAANLTVLPTTGVTNTIANTAVLLNNPFTSGLTITNIQSNITARGLYLGSIVTETNFPAAGHAGTYSPELPFTLNLFPPDIFSLLRQLATEAGLSTAQIDGIVALGGYDYVPTTGPPSSRMVKRDAALETRSLIEGGVDASAWSVFGQDDYEHLLVSPSREIGPGEKFQADLISSPDLRSISEWTSDRLADVKGLWKRQADIYRGFDLPSFVDQAFSHLTVEVGLVSGVNIGDYHTTLTYAQQNVPVRTDATLHLLLPILAAPIVQKLVDAATLSIDTVIITNPQPTSFGTTLTGAITNAGPFDARITFASGLRVFWDGAELGSLAMPDVALTGDVGASLNLQSAFTVADVGRLTDFTRYLLTEPEFTWQIQGTELEVSALGIVVPGISISKTVVLNGINSLRNNGVVIRSFDLPANDPAGGVHLTLETTITNPSSVGVELSGISFQNFYGDTNIGPASAASAFTLLPKASFDLSLVGRLVPQSSQEGLDDVSTLFNAYLHGIPAHLVVQGDSAGPSGVSWLNDAISSLRVPVILPAAVDLEVITSIALNQVTLDFPGGTDWAPLFSTDNTVATFQLPFAFPVDITQIQNSITAVDGRPFANIEVPLSPAQTNVQTRVILLTFANVPFAAIGSAHDTFSQYLTDVTQGTTKNFGLTGNANTIAGTAIGNLHVDDIVFGVETSLAGLQGLNAQPTTVSDLDVFHGYSDYLQINTNAHLFNPSNITIITGDVAFNLVFQGQTIGTANIAGLTLVPGNNTVATAVHYSPSGGAARAAGQVLLENYIQAIVSSTVIQGSRDTTPYASLKQALASISLNTQIPPLEQNLITQATLKFPLNIAQTGLATSTFTLVNPFTASINLEAVVANATYHGINLGRINQRNLSPVISAAGHSTITSRELPFEFNIDPKAIIEFLFIASQVNGVDLGPLPPLLQYVHNLPSTDTPVTPTPDLNPPNCHSGQQFDVLGAILATLKNLFVDLTIESTTRLDDYRTDLDFVQHNVSAVTVDDTALYLVGIVGAPLVQALVDQSTLQFSQANISQVTDDGFQVDSCSHSCCSGPFDALISFPKPVTVSWEGSNIATITLPDLCAAANTAIPDLVTTGQLTITNQGKFTEFATAILHDPSFEWTISTDVLRVRALDIIFDNVTLSKVIGFQAFNGLPGVTISNFELPADDPAGGITISTDSSIPSPANLGIVLGKADFTSSFQGVTLGPIVAENLALAPMAVTNTHLDGRIIPQKGDNLETIGVLFSNYLQGVNQTLDVTGLSVTSPAQPDSPVSWLSKAFKTLTLEVILPGHQYEIINSIKLLDLEAVLVEKSQDFHIPISNKETDAVFTNPFGFSLTPLRSGENITAAGQGYDVATLDIPMAPVVSAGTSTGQPAPLVLKFSNVTFDSVIDPAYQQFFRGVTLLPEIDFILKGGADVLAETAIGNVPISGIPFNVSTSLVGLSDFGGTATIPERPLVVGSGSNSDRFGNSTGSDFIRITLDVILNNPSQITLTTNEVALDVVYNGTVVGEAVIADLNLVPGSNTIPSQFHYMPADPNNANAESLLTAYLSTTDQIPIQIHGSESSTPYGSLAAALEGVTLQSSFAGLGTPLVTHIDIFLDIFQSLCDKETELTFTITNELETPIFIERTQVNAYQDDHVQYGSFDHTFQTPLEGPPHVVSDNSERIVSELTQGLFGSLPLLANWLLNHDRGLDLDITARAAVGSLDGYTIPSLFYHQVCQSEGC